LLGRLPIDDYLSDLAPRPRQPPGLIAILIARQIAN
jgi:hypothetical protein